MFVWGVGEVALRMSWVNPEWIEYSFSGRWSVVIWITFPGIGKWGIVNKNNPIWTNYNKMVQGYTQNTLMVGYLKNKFQHLLPCVVGITEWNLWGPRTEKRLPQKKVSISNPMCCGHDWEESLEASNAKKHVGKTSLDTGILSWAECFVWSTPFWGLHHATGWHSDVWIHLKHAPFRGTLNDILNLPPSGEHRIKQKNRFCHEWRYLSLQTPWMKHTFGTQYVMGKATIRIISRIPGFLCSRLVGQCHVVECPNLCHSPQDVRNADCRYACRNITWFVGFWIVVSISSTAGDRIIVEKNKTNTLFIVHFTPLDINSMKMWG